MTLIGSLEMVGYKNQQVAGCHGTERILVTGYNEDSTPKTEVGYDGLRLMIRPSLSDNRQSVNLQVNGTITKILSVDKVKTEHGEVQVPKIYRSPIRLSPTVEAGKPVVLIQSGSVEGYGQGKTQLLILIRTTPMSEK